MTVMSSNKNLISVMFTIPIMDLMSSNEIHIYSITIRPLPRKRLRNFTTNSQRCQLPVGLVAQLVEHCTGIVGVMGSNPDQARIFFRLSFHNCLSCVHNCDR